MNTTNDVIYENKQLKHKINELIKENKELKMKLQGLQDTFDIKIVEYFNNCRSLKQTTEYFYFENVRECYKALLEYYGSSYHPLQTAIDYNECYKEIFG